MKVLFLSQAVPYPPYRDGFTLRTYQILTRVAARHETHLVAFTDQPLHEQAVTALKHVCRSVVIIPVLPHRRRWDRFISTLPAQTLPYRRAAAAHGLAGSYDLIHAEGASMAAVAQLRNDVPALMSATDASSSLHWQLFRDGVYRARLAHAIRWLKMKRLERTYGTFGACVIATEKDVSRLRHVRGARLVVIPNGVDTDYFTPRRAPQNAEILFTGVLSYEPNVDAVQHLVVNILPIVRKQIPHAIVRVVGRSPVDTVKALHAPLAGVDIVGEVDDLRPQMNRAAVYASPLRLGVGIKNKILEAFAMALPVVATPESLDGIRARHGCHCLVASDPEALATAISQLLCDPLTAATLGDAARSFVVSDHSWHAAAARYLGLYGELVSRAPTATVRNRRLGDESSPAARDE
jgi:polysaccharide biosynthesis protein PslH